MTFRDAQADLNTRFNYRPDGRLGRWRVMRDHGPVWGDCEDYALTLIWLAEGRSWLRFWFALVSFKYLLWVGKSPSGATHAILWVRGHGWTDNILQKPSARLPASYRRGIPYPAPLVALMLILSRILSKLS